MTSDPPAPPAPARPLLALAGYLLAAALATGLAAYQYDVTTAEKLRVPFTYVADGLYYLGMNKTIAETGWYYHNDRLGQLGGLDYRDFPTGDGWAHLGLVALLMRAGVDPLTASNVFFLLTFPLTAVSATFVGRRLGLAYPVALAVALLYTFQPYHTARVQHVYLAACHFVPLAVLLMVRLYQGRLPFARDAGGWTLRTPAALGAILIAALVGAGGVYYAFFSCFLLMVAGAARSYADRRWAPALSAGLICGVVGATMFATLLPSVHYKLTRAKNSDAAVRSPAEAETLGLKVVQMVVPVTTHRWEPLRAFKARYSLCGTPLVNENDVSALGAVGAFGLLFLLARLALRRGESGQVLDALALLMAAGILLATVGGLGSLFSWVVSPWIRAYNRISIVLAFFALLAVGVLLDRLGRWAAGRPARRAGFYALLAGLTAGGLWDEIPVMTVSPHEGRAEQMRVDREFVVRVEASAPRGGLVFQLPHSGYPERLLPSGLPGYEMFRPYLHSAHLRWSYGGISGHLGDEWAKGLARRPAAVLLARLAEADAAGVWVDRAGYADGGAKVEAEIRAALAAEPAVSEGGRHAYYDLRPFAARLRSGAAADEWAARRERALNPLVPLWRNGFYTDEPVSPTESTHWCARAGELHLNNPLDRPRALRLKFWAWTPARPGQPVIPLRVRAGEWSQSLDIGPDAKAVEGTLVLPPGETVVRLTCYAPPLVNPADPRRKMVFAVANVEYEEVPVP